MSRIVIVTSHLGFGHFTRELGLATELLRMGHTIDFVCDEQKIQSFSNSYSTNFRFVESPPMPTFVFNGHVLDLESTRYTFQTMLDFETQVRDYRQWDRILESADLVINDIESYHNPIVKKFDIPMVNISNFTWSDLLFHVGLKDIGNQIAELESMADLSIRLPFNTPCSSFTQMEQRGLMLRTFDHELQKTHSIVIKELPKLVKFSIQELIAILKSEGWQIYVSQTVIIAPKPSDGDYTVILDTDNYLKHLAQAEIYIGKSGYSTVAECAYYGTKLLFWIREGLMEDLALRDAVYAYGMGEMITPTLNEVREQIRKLSGSKFDKFENDTGKIAERVAEFL